jgi:hypothetical protein
LTDDELHTDLVSCHQYFKDKLGLDSHILSYPNGRFKEGQKEMLERLGIPRAMTPVAGYEEGGVSDNLAIRRIGFGSESLSEFIFRLRRLNLLK